MRPQTKISILFLSVFFCAAMPALASEISLATLSDQDLAATVTGSSIAIALRADLQDDQPGARGIEGGRFQNFSGIETINTNSSQASVSQAATSLTVRAKLMMAGFAF
ncbi:MAG: hypothetical protein ACXWLT_07500 [Rhizomicrobium sp.]